MRLLLTGTLDDGQFKFLELPGLRDPPPYAVLSHTWTNEEILFRDIESKDPSIRTKSGYQKLLGCCRQAREDGYEHVWIDTCCIDRSSSSDVSEAVNSMHSLYRDAALCYVYLADVSSLEDGPEYRRSRWFTRGWTLEELIAPRHVKFYNSHWELIGDKDTLVGTITNITGIDYDILRSWRAPGERTVATRISWAANRQTTLIEDRAYSLMGLFGLNWPADYGAGGGAFTRLQYEIISLLPQHSIFAWNVCDDSINRTVALADSPDNFAIARSNAIMDVPSTLFERNWGCKRKLWDYCRTPDGIALNVPMFRIPEALKSKNREQRIDVIAVIACKWLANHEQMYSLGLALQRSGASYVRVYPRDFVAVDVLVDLGLSWSVESLTLADDPSIVSGMNRSFVGSQEIQLTVDALTLKYLRIDGGFVFVPSPVDPDYANFTTSHDWTPPAHLLNKQLDYVRTEGGDIVFTINTEALPREITFLQVSPGRTSKGASKSRILSMIVRRNLDEQLFIRIQCLHHPDQRQVMESDFFIAAHTNCTKFLCECGLTLEAEIVCPMFPPITGTWSPSYALIMKCRADIRPWPFGNFSGDTLARKSFSRGGYIPGRALKWVEGTAGYVPPDAIRASRDGNPVYVSRISHEFMSSGLSSSFSPETHPSNLAALQINGTPTAQPLSYHGNDERLKHSLGYEVLVGPANFYRWIECEGVFSIKALGGAVPIKGGYDVDDVSLYFARGTETNNLGLMGAVKEGSRANLGSITDSDVFFCHGEFDQYEVLVFTRPGQLCTFREYGCV